MSRRSSMLGGVASSASYGLATIVSGLALLPVVLSTVGAGPYGMWLLLSTLSSYLYQADLGMGSSVLYHTAKLRDGDADELRAVMSSSVAWMTGAGLLALPVFLVAGHELLDHRGAAAGVTGAEGRDLLVLGGLLLALLGLRAFPAALQGSGSWTAERGMQLTGVGVRVAGTIAACALGGGVVGVAAAEVAGLVTPLLLATAKAHRLGLARVSIDAIERRQLRELFSYGIRAFALASMGAVVLEANVIIVGLVLSAAAVSYYTVALRIYTAIRQVLGWTTAPLLPVLSRLQVGDTHDARRVLIAMFFASLWLAGLVCGGMAVAGHDVIRLWLGDEVPSGEIAGASAVMLLGLFANASFLPAFPATSALGRPAAFLRLQAAWAASNVVLAVVLGEAFGIVGVAVAMTAPLLALQPLHMRLVGRLLDVQPDEWRTACMRPVAISLGAGAASAACVYALAGTLPAAWASWASLMAGVGFGVAFLAASGCARRWLPMSDLRFAAATRL